MSIIHLNEIELEKFLANFGNKTEIVREAVREYKQRHYDGVYFSKEEMLEDIIKYEKQLKESKEKLELLKKLLEDSDVKNDTNDTTENTKLLKKTWL